MVMLMGMFSGHGGGSRDAALITEWVERTYAPIRVDGVAIYDLTAAPTS